MTTHNQANNSALTVIYESSDLTNPLARAMLLMLSQKTKAGRENPINKGGKSPQPYVAFLCASFCAALCRLSIMAGCFGQSQDWPVPLSGILTPLQPVAHAVRSMIGGYPPTQRSYRMKTQSNSAQNPEQPNPELFYLVVLTHEFSSRAKYGEQLLMMQGIATEDGDIVAVGFDGVDCPRLAFYANGLRYYAVAVAILRKSHARSAAPRLLKHISNGGRSE